MSERLASRRGKGGGSDAAVGHFPAVLPQGGQAFDAVKLTLRKAGRPSAKWARL